MQLRFKHLTVCLLSTMLIACGGGGEGENNKPNDPLKTTLQVQRIIRIKARWWE
jgi:hypothetical protein